MEDGKGANLPDLTAPRLRPDGQAGLSAGPRSEIGANLRLVFSAVSTPAGPSAVESAHFVAHAELDYKMRVRLEQRVRNRMSSRQIQLSSSEEKGKALEVARTAGSADAFPVHRKRHHYGMEDKDGRNEVEKGVGHIQISTLETQHRDTEGKAWRQRALQPAE